MDFHQLVHARRSHRAFASDQPVAAEHVQVLLETALRAPSAGNLQAYQIYVVTDGDQRGRLAQAALNQDFIAQAPLVLVFFADPVRSLVRYGARGARLFCIQDATLACAYAQLAATDLGLGSVWIGSFDDAQVRQVIGAGKELCPVALLPIGISSATPERSTRRPRADLVHYAA